MAAAAEVSRASCVDDDCFGLLGEVRAVRHTAIASDVVQESVSKHWVQCQANTAAETMTSVFRFVALLQHEECDGNEQKEQDGGSSSMSAAHLNKQRHTACKSSYAWHRPCYVTAMIIINNFRHSEHDVPRLQRQLQP